MAFEKAQVATEYLVMVGVLLVAVGTLAGYSILMYTETVAANQVKDALNDLQLAVNNIHDLGEGNSVVVKIVLPNNVVETKVVGRAIYITTSFLGGNSQDVVETDANVQGSIPAEGGIYYIEVKAVDGNVGLAAT